MAVRVVLGKIGKGGRSVVMQKLQTSKAVVAKTSVLTTVTGGVHFAKARFGFFPTKHAFVKMHHLHLRSHMKLSAPDAAKHRVTSAKFFRRALECTIGNYLVVSDELRLGFAGYLLDAVEHVKGFGGLESLFLTAMTTAGHLGQAALFDRGAKLWVQFGAPEHVGGALKAALVVDATNNRVAYIGKNGLASLAPGGVHANVIAPGHINDVYGTVASTISALDAGIAQDGDGVCVTGFSIAGGMAGGWFGGKKGGKVGEALGHEAGSIAGKALGGVICGAFDSETSLGSDGARGGADGQGGYKSDSSTTSGGTEGGGQAGGDEKNTCEPDDPDDGDSGGGDDDSGGGDDSGDDAGKPDPDDSMPVPPEVGYQMLTSSYAMGAGVASHMSKMAGGGVLLTGVSKLNLDGSVANAGIIASISEIAQQVASQAANRIAGGARIDVGAVAGRVAGRT